VIKGWLGLSVVGSASGGQVVGCRVVLSVLSVVGSRLSGCVVPVVGLSFVGSSVVGFAVVVLVVGSY